MHSGIIEKATEEPREEKLAALLKSLVRAAGRDAATETRPDAPAIAREIMQIEELFGTRGTILEQTPDRCVRQVTWCPWSWFNPLSCRCFAWWMEGFVNERFS